MGSPYQTSLSEAGQDKFFYCVQRGPHRDHRATDSCSRTDEIARSVDVEAETWKEVERWTVSIGSKIIKVFVLSELEALLLC